MRQLLTQNQRNMKKLFLIAAIAAVSTSANAQAGFGIQVGGNLGNAKSESTYGGTTTKEETKAKFGFLVGVVADAPLTSSLAFRPELNFIQKGAKSDFTESFGGITYTEKDEITLNFIELLLNLVYNVPAGSGTFFIGAGPSIGFGISGKDKWTSTTTGLPNESGTTDVKFDGEKNSGSTDNKLHLKSLDFGANILAGYKLPMGVFFNLGYTMGFSNLSPDDNSSIKTNGFALKLGYMFGGNNSTND